MITKVSDTLFVGDQQDALKLIMAGKKIIIMTVAFDSGVRGTFFYPLVDGPHPDNERNFQDAVDKLVQLQKAKIQTFVHCISGESRSSAVVIGYLMRSQNIDYGEAYKQLFAIRPQIKLAEFFVDILSKGMWEDIVARFKTHG